MNGKRKAVESIENGVTKIIKRSQNVDKAHKWLNGSLPTPYQELNTAYKQRSTKKPVSSEKGDYVLHWFRSDLRINDNKGLAKASQLAQELNLPLITLYIISWKEFESHFLSNIKIDLIIRTLFKLRTKLSNLNIPLIIETTTGRDFVGKLDEICDKYNVHNIVANYEYEIDELRRDKQVIEKLSSTRYIKLVHDQCIVEPDTIKSKTGAPFKVFKAWYNDWCRRLYHSDDKYLDLASVPMKNGQEVTLPSPASNSSIIEIPERLKIDDETAKRMREMYTDDEDEVVKHCEAFLKTKLKDYESGKDYPADSKTSKLSPYINVGLISTRHIVSTVFKQYHDNKASSTAFIREVAWRDFYRHKIVEFPHVVMNLPFNLKTVNIEWENDPIKFEKWCQGETGFPFVDASMKKLNHEGHLDNRCRMVVANFLVKNLLIDWRYGEQYFMKHLIDGDFASNNGGWGFISSTGVNCQPFFRVFNPELQLKNYDPDHEFINKWLDINDDDGYDLDPIVDYKKTKEVYIENFRKTM